MSSSGEHLEHLEHHIGIAVGDHLAQPRQTVHVVLGHCLLLAFGLHHPRGWSSGRLFVDVIEANLKAALDLTENCGSAYKAAPDHIRRLFNQAFFKRILVGSDTSVETELAPPFDFLLGAQMQALSREAERETSENTNEPTQLSGLIANKNSNRRTGHRLAFPFVQGLSKTLLVPPREFET